MAAGEQGDRTEPGTQRRLQRARDEGQVAVSPELAPLFMLGGVAGVLLWTGSASVHGLADGLADLMVAAGRLDGAADIAAALRAAARIAARALATLCGVAMAAGAAAVLLQTGFLFSLAKLRPDLSRLSPGRGLHRLFGIGNFANAGKSLLKMAAVGYALWRLLQGRRDQLASALLRPVGTLPATMTELVIAILLTAIWVQLAIAILDIVAVRIRHAGTMRMSRTEISDEMRDADGNPEVKAKQRRVRSQRARQRMIQAVARATVVITNPTHYAVALAYDRSRNAAPRVVAKGMDEMAARIRAAADENRVPMVANPPLARALHKVELDSDVPPEHYQAVAELIAYVWRLQDQARRRPS